MENSESIKLGSKVKAFKIDLRLILLLLLLSFVFIFVRIALIQTATERYWDGEEFHQGAVARAICGHRILPWSFYLNTDYALISVFSGAMSSIAFMLFGQSLFSLKLPAIFMSLLTAILWFLWWRKNGGVYQGLIAFFLWTVPFPGLLSLQSVNGTGGHGDILFAFPLIALMLQKAEEFKRKEDKKLSFYLITLAGFAGGLSATLSLSALPALIAAAILFFLPIKRFVLKDVFCFVTGSLIGLSPLFALRLFLRYSGLNAGVSEPWSFLRYGSVSETVTEMFSRAILILSKIPVALGFIRSNALQSSNFNNLVLILVISTLIIATYFIVRGSYSSLKTGRQAKWGIYPLLILFIFLMVYIFSPHPVGQDGLPDYPLAYRYYAVIMGAMLMLLPGLSRFYLKTGILAVTIVISVNIFYSIPFENIALKRDSIYVRKGYDYYNQGIVAGRRTGGDAEKFKIVIQKVGNIYAKEELYTGFGAFVEWRMPSERIAASKSIEQEFLDDYWIGVGVQRGWIDLPDSDHTVFQILSDIKDEIGFDKSDETFFKEKMIVKGLGIVTGLVSGKSAAYLKDIVAGSLSEKDMHALIDGYVFGSMQRYGFKITEENISDLPERYLLTAKESITYSLNKNYIQ